jgi:uncharacterized protein (DUF3084 family)
MLDNHMLAMIGEINPEYKNFLKEKHAMSEPNMRAMRDERNNEKRRDDENLKTNVEYYKQKYIEVLEDNRVLSRQAIDASQRAKEAYKEVAQVLREKDSLLKELRAMRANTPVYQETKNDTPEEASTEAIEMPEKKAQAA